jgi:pimeloyl-ACP methyl ester carboxylesterase
MEVFFHENYAEPSDPLVLKQLPEEALTIHKRSDGNTALVIFVHGFGGSRYGEKSTWGNFPQFLFEDIPELDVGLYEYRTLFGRMASPGKSVSLPDEAEAFADIIRDRKEYQRVFLIGHSMGGLLCMAAIAHLLDSRQQDVILRIGGLILMATPQAGSQRVPFFGGLFSKDFQALKPHGAFVTDLHTTFVNNRVVLDETRAQNGDIVIPTWAVIGTSDYWVDKLSAGMNIPASRRKSVRGTHKEIVKPASKTSDAYQYVRDRIKQVFLQPSTTLSLPWSPLEEAFEGETPHFLTLLRWNYRLVENLIGRESDFDAILKWVESNPQTPSARLVTGEGGAGKTRLAATVAQLLRDKGWIAGFLNPKSNDPFDVGHSHKGVFLIVDYPEEKPEQTKAVLEGLAERKTASCPLRVLFLSRRTFAEWEREALLLEGRFGKQAISVAKPLSVDEGLKLIEEAAGNFAAHAKLPTPGFVHARQWLGASDMHRLPLYATAAAIHAVLEPEAAFGLSHAELLKNLADREIRRVQETSKALGLGKEGLERLLALGVLADGLSESAMTELAKAGVCENPSIDIVSALARSSWWKNGRLARLEPDAAGAAFLNFTLFGPSFPKGRDALPEWMFIALRQNAATLGGRLGRILYDLHTLRVLRPKDEIRHPLEERLVQMVVEKPDRAETFVDVATSESPFWTANFAACVTLTLAERATSPETKAVYLNSLAVFLSELGRREEALAAAQEAITKLIFRLIVRKIVERLQHQRLEDHHFVSRLAFRRTLALRVVLAKLVFDQRRLQLRPEAFEWNHHRNGNQWIVFGVQAFIAPTQIKETKLPHAELPRSEAGSFESDLRGGWKREFFEVPTGKCK